MTHALFVSPHLDDATFSVGGTIARLACEGRRVVLATVFTRSVPDPAGFALSCQTTKGVAPGVDYMAVRRDEDRHAARLLGVADADVLHLDLPEAPHRGYGSGSALFGGVHDDDRHTPDAVADVLRPILDVPHDPDVYYPLGLGGHVDHLHVITAVEHLVPAGRRFRWADTPYVLRDPPPPGQGRSDVSTTMSAKLDACTAYVTQLPLQFGGVVPMREALDALARRTAAGTPWTHAEYLSRPQDAETESPP